jgi:hypothetical protein
MKDLIRHQESLRNIMKIFPPIFSNCCNTIRLLVVVAIFATASACVQEETVEPSEDASSTDVAVDGANDLDSGPPADVYNGEPIYEQLAEDDPNLVCCYIRQYSHCSVTWFGGRRPCNEYPASGPHRNQVRHDRGGIEDTIVDGCPVWIITDDNVTFCEPPDSGSAGAPPVDAGGSDAGGDTGDGE